jgi:predicted ester cyclase
MNTQDLAEAFTETFHKKDLDATASFLADEFQFSGPVPEPISGPQWIGLLTAMNAAFPDINYNVRILSVDGDTIVSDNRITGTHTADFDLTPMGIGVIPATGKSVSNPAEQSKTRVKDGKIASMHIDATENGGLMGILKQIGVEPPR